MVGSGQPAPSAHHSDEVAELRRELAESKSVIDQYSLNVENMFVEHRTALLKLNTIETTTDLDLTDLNNRFNLYTKNLEKDVNELRDQVRILASDVDDKAKPNTTLDNSKLGRFQMNNLNGTKVRLDLIEVDLEEQKTTSKALQESLAAAWDFIMEYG